LYLSSPLLSSPLLISFSLSPSHCCHRVHWPGLRGPPCSSFGYEEDEALARQLQQTLDETGGSGRYEWED